MEDRDLLPWTFSELNLTPYVRIVRRYRRLRNRVSTDLRREVLEALDVEDWKHLKELIKL